MADEYSYRRKLPHLQGRGGPILVTFVTSSRAVLSEQSRDLVLQHCLKGAELHYRLYAAVVMPDHVHLILEPKEVDGKVLPLKTIMQALKGASAHSINRALNRKGAVWQDESFDHVIRSEDKLEDAIIYLLANPLRQGLAKQIDEYRWCWRA